ncbi:hypothetical protein V1264_001203 [Littorina saxatilis]|uniref:FHA domain-containing protein n=2 Tax=Littorina saxatilis TaxID=31220 RepID=A0AAN9C102_9CAEN
MADESMTCCTVETPSRLMLFYPDSTPCALITLLPTQPISKPVGQHVTMGRSSTADIRLNDERMSRLYASLWHDGKDPFVFRVSNLSERKMLMVDGVMLRYQEEAEVKDGTSLTLDFLQLKARVCGGDYVAFSYQVSFVKNVVISPPSVPPAAPPPPDGKCLMPPRRNSVSGRDLSSVFSCSDTPHSTSLGTAEDVVNKLLTCLQAASLDSGLGANMSVKPRTPYLDATRRQGTSLDSGMGAGFSFPPGATGYASYDRRYSEDVGVEYELPENLSTMGLGDSSVAEPPSGLSTVSMPPSVYHTGNKLSLNIPPSLVHTPGASAELTASTAPATPQLQNNLFRLSSASHASGQAAPQQHSAGGKQCAAYTTTSPPPPPPQQQQQNQYPYQLSSISPPVYNQLATSAKKDFSCWFNLETTSTLKPQTQKGENIRPPDLPEIAQRVQDALVDSKKNQVCSACSCRGGGGGSGGGGTSVNMAVVIKPVPDMTQKMALADMVVREGQRRGSPVENSDWDTDDTNINCYMK